MGNSLWFLSRALARYFAYQISALINTPLIGPRSAVLSVESRCNSICLYCPVHLNNSNPQASRPTTEELTSVIHQLHQLGVHKLVFSGGEPLIRSDLADLIRVASQLGMHPVLLTNGLSLTKKRLDEVLGGGVKAIVISLDTLNPEIYKLLRGVEMSRIERAIRLLVETSQTTNVDAGLTCVVTMLNLQGLNDLIDFAASNAVGISFQPYTPIPGYERFELIPTQEMVPELTAAIDHVIAAKEKGKPVLNSVQYLRAIPQFMVAHSINSGRHCLAGFTGINIDAQLNVLPCWSLPAVGNLREESLEYIWNSQSFAATRSQMVRLECPGCLYLCHHEYQFG